MWPGRNKTFSTIYSIFNEDLFCDESPDKAAALLLLRESGDFVKYILDVTSHNVTHAKEHGMMKGIGGLHQLFKPSFQSEVQMFSF